MLIDDLEKQHHSVARQNETCQRLIEIPDVGPLIATATVTIMGEDRRLNPGERWLPVSLVPKQSGSG